LNVPRSQVWTPHRRQIAAGVPDLPRSRARGTAVRRPAATASGRSSCPPGARAAVPRRSPRARRRGRACLPPAPWPQRADGVRVGPTDASDVSLVSTFWVGRRTGYSNRVLFPRSAATSLTAMLPSPSPLSPARLMTSCRESGDVGMRILTASACAASAAVMAVVTAGAAYVLGSHVSGHGK